VDVPLFSLFWIVSVLLSSKSHEALVEQVHLEWIEASDEGIDPQIVLETVNQMRIGNVLGHDVAGLALDLLLAANNFNSPTATRRVRLHNVHVLEIFLLSVDDELAVIVREQIRLRCKVELVIKQLLHS